VQRNNLKAGVFVVAGGLGLLAAVLLLADLRSWLERRQQVHVIYRLSDGLQGLRSGAVVTLGGEPVGQVLSITDALAPVDDPQRVVGKVVTFELPRRYRLYENAHVELVVPALGTGTSLNVRSVGTGVPLREGQPLQGTLAGSLLTANLLRDAGIEDDQRRQIREILANLRNLSATLSRDVPAMTASLNTLLTEAQPAVREAQQVVSELKQACASVNTVLAQVKDHSQQWVQNIDATSASAASAAGRLDTVLAAGQPLIARALASLETTAAQLKLASIEIRRSPWRLLYKPSNRELESENVYDAARSFALAADSLDSAAVSLNSLRQSGAAADQDVNQMLQHLQQLFSRFEQAEGQLWQALQPQAAADNR